MLSSGEGLREPVLIRDLKAASVGAVRMFSASRFQSNIVDGRNELRYSWVRHGIIGISVAFLRTYRF